jgi:L-fucose isomerase-like protein
MQNIPSVKLGIVAVSRDCFPVQLAEKRRAKLAEVSNEKGLTLVELKTTIQSENDIPNILKEINDKKVNSLVIYLGNFGPETPSSMLAQKFAGPVMFIAAAEETGKDLIDGRGDAYCGMLNASYNIGLRGIKPYIPEYPAGTFEELADKISGFIPIARTLLALKKLKIFSFGPRPQDFLACNAPIAPLYKLGIEIMENSELDLYDIYMSQENNSEVKQIASDMAKELDKGNTYPDILMKLAQYEAALTGFMAKNLGTSEYGIFANKCWPSFEKYFGFVPCYVNSRLASRGIPVSCEVDIYGALSEYIAVCATGLSPTLLDINNTVPLDMAEKVSGYKPTDLFMGFHCGNTASSCMIDPKMKYQLIMHRLMEPEKTPDITRGTLEGRIKPGDLTILRLQSTADSTLKAYIAEGEVIDIDPKSFGGIGVIAVKEMARFYRHVLIEKRFPHHAAIAFKHAGKPIFEIFKMLGISDISYNKPEGMLYETENPF